MYAVCRARAFSAKPALGSEGVGLDEVIWMARCRRKSTATRVPFGISKSPTTSYCFGFEEHDTGLPGGGASFRWQPHRPRQACSPSRLPHPMFRIVHPPLAAILSPLRAVTQLMDSAVSVVSSPASSMVMRFPKITSSKKVGLRHRVPRAWLPGNSTASRSAGLSREARLLGWMTHRRAKLGAPQRVQ